MPTGPSSFPGLLSQWSEILVDNGCPLRSQPAAVKFLRLSTVLLIALAAGLGGGLSYKLLTDREQHLVRPCLAFSPSSVTRSALFRSLSPDELRHVGGSLLPAAICGLQLLHTLFTPRERAASRARHQSSASRATFSRSLSGSTPTQSTACSAASNRLSPIASGQPSCSRTPSACPRAATRCSRSSGLSCERSSTLHAPIPPRSAPLTTPAISRRTSSSWRTTAYSCSTPFRTRCQWRTARRFLGGFTAQVRAPPFGCTTTTTKNNCGRHHHQHHKLLLPSCCCPSREQQLRLPYLLLLRLRRDRGRLVGRKDRPRALPPRHARRHDPPERPRPAALLRRAVADGPAPQEQLRAGHQEPPRRPGAAHHHRPDAHNG